MYTPAPVSNHSALQTKIQANIQTSIQASIQARGFTLTQSLLSATQTQLDAYRARFPRAAAVVSIRLYDVNGLRGGPDKGCLAQAQLGKHHVSVVASDVDSELYTAIQRAFAKLTRATRSALTRARSLQRRGRHAQQQVSVRPVDRDRDAAAEGLGG